MLWSTCIILIALITECFETCSQTCLVYFVFRMSNSQSYSSGISTNLSNNFGNFASSSSSSSNGNTMSNSQTFGNNSGWNAFSSAPQIPQQPKLQQQPKPDLSAFDSLMPLSKPKQSMSTLQSGGGSVQPNYFQSVPTSSLNNGILFPQPKTQPTNVKTLSPSDINDLLS